MSVNLCFAIASLVNVILCIFVDCLLVRTKFLHSIAYHYQNRLKVGTDKHKPNVNMQSVSDDDVRKRLLEKPRFELTVKGVFRLGRCYIFWQVVPDLWESNRESTATDG